jgi:energy-coupling factor transporter ATP-binding protein EcfA2
MKVQEIKSDLITLGLNDNIDLALLIYLAASVRKTAGKISALVTGPAGTGKSFLVNTIMGLIPDEDVISISRMTPAALVSCGDLSHKIISIYENFKDPQFAQYVRELISEGEVVYITANKEYRLKGPTTLIETTANPQIVLTENKSRYFVPSINTSEEAKANILNRQKMLRTKEGLWLKKSALGIQSKHRQFQKSLDSSIGVLIPFANEIRFCSISQHAPRIIERILNVISAIAYVDQKEREVVLTKAGRYVEATKDDFETAREILINLSVDEGGFILPEDTTNFFEILVEHKEELSQKGCFTRNTVLNIVANSNSPYKGYKSVMRHLTILSQMGFIDESPIRGRKNRCEYTFSKTSSMTTAGKFLRNCYVSLSLA